MRFFSRKVGRGGWRSFVLSFFVVRRFGIRGNSRELVVYEFRVAVISSFSYFFVGSLAKTVLENIGLLILYRLLFISYLVDVIKLLVMLCRGYI